MANDGEVSYLDPQTMERWNNLVTSYRGAQGGEPIFAEPARFNPQAGAQNEWRQPTQQGTLSVMGGPAGLGGEGQVQNLGQLQQVIGVLGKLPPDLRDTLLQRFTGVPFRSERQIAMENALAQIRQKHALEAPLKEAELGRRIEEGAQRQQAVSETRDYRQELLRMREEQLAGQQANQLKALSEIAQNSLDPNVKAAIGQIILRALGSLGGGQGSEQAPLAAQPSEKAAAGVTIKRIR